MHLNSELTAQQQQILVLLAQGNTVNAAAEAVGIHRNTVANWRRSSEAFRSHWHNMQYEQAMHWRDQLQSIAQIAVDAILKTLTDEKTPPSVRLRAALAVLGKMTAVPAAQPGLKPSQNDSAAAPHNHAQQSTVVAQSAQACTAAPPGPFEALRDVADDSLDNLLEQMCKPPGMHNLAQSAPRGNRGS